MNLNVVILRTFTQNITPFNSIALNATQINSTSITCYLITADRSLYLQVAQPAGHVQ